MWGKTGIAFLHHKDIWLSDATGRHVRRLTHTRAGLQPAHFSADGRELIAWKQSDSGQLWAVDVPSGNARRLLPHGQGLIPLGLSSDGKTVLAVDGCAFLGYGRGTVETIPFAGGKPRSIGRTAECSASWNAG